MGNAGAKRLGQIGGVPQYRLWGEHARAVRVDIRVYFGRQDPSQRAIAEADAMLAQLRFGGRGPRLKRTLEEPLELRWR